MSHSPADKFPIPQEAVNGLITNANPNDLPQSASPWCQNRDFKIGSNYQRGGLVNQYSFGGESQGPFAGATAVDVVEGGSEWTNPSGILSNGSSGATVVLSNGGSPTSIPSAGTDLGGSYPWTTPANLKTTGTGYATISMTIPSTPPTPPPPVGGQPNISSVNPTSGYAGTTSVTIVGTGFGASQSTSYVLFGASRATIYSAWTSTSITVTVPSGVPLGAVVVQVYVGGATGGGASFTVTQAPVPPPPPGGGGGGGGGCFTPNSKLWGFTPIASVRKGDKVWIERADGKLVERTVKETQVYDYNGLLHHVGGDTYCTPNHRFKQADGSWKRADELFHTTMDYRGKVHNLQIDTDDEDERNYVLWNGAVAHNVKIASLQLDPVESNYLVGQGFSFNIPSTAQIVGIGIQFKAFGSGTGIVSLQAQLASNGVPVGTVSNANLSGSATTYNFGGSSNTLGTDLGATGVNGTALTVLLQAIVTGSTGQTGAFSVNSLKVTVYYASPSFCDPLNVDDFGFSLNATSAVQGIVINLTGKQSASGGTISLQLLKNGIATGQVITKSMPVGTLGTVSFGGLSTLWDNTWLYSDINNVNWGVQIKASSGAGSSVPNLTYITATVYQTPSLENFNYIWSYSPGEGSGIYKNLALSADGILWQENIVSDPFVFTSLLENIQPGSFMNASVFAGNTYMTFSNLQSGTDLPRQYTNQWVDQISQTAPGAPPLFQSTLDTSDTATVTSWSITSDVVAFVISALSEPYAVGTLVTPSGLVTGSFMNGSTMQIIGSPAPTDTGFSATFVHPNASATEAGTITPQYGYPVGTITQGAAYSPGFDGQEAIWSDGPGSTAAGTVWTFFYGGTGATEWTPLVNQFNLGIPVYVYITGAPFGNGTQLVLNHGTGIPPSHEHQPIPFFTVQAPNSNAQVYGGPNGTGPSGGGNDGDFQLTLATVTVTEPIPNLNDGDQVVISGSNQASWDNTWTVVNTLNSGVLIINSTALASDGTATYGYTVLSGSNPTVGQLITISNTVNGNGVFNITDAPISSVSGTSSGTFTIQLSGGTTVASEPELNGQGQTAGTQFEIDPGSLTVGSATDDPIYGNGTGGTATTVGGSNQPIAAGTRRGIVMFESRNGFITGCSPYSEFTTTDLSNYILASNIPIGPADTAKRHIAFTEAGQNGVPGANFFVVEFADTFTLNGQTYTYTSTVIEDNVTQVAKFTFPDSVLIGGTPIDVDGQNQFNLIELGNSSFTCPYAGRLFVGGEQNKVQNLINMSFNGGYNSNPNNPLLPLGWGFDPAYNPSLGVAATITSFSITSNVVTIVSANTFVAGQQVAITGLSTGTYLNGNTLTVLATGLSTTSFEAVFENSNVGVTADSGSATAQNFGMTLVTSPIFGQSLYNQNMTGETQAVYGMILQTAYQDQNQVPILQVQQEYGVRVTAWIPSGNTNGNLVIDFTDVNQNGTGYGTTYGKLVIPFSQLTVDPQIITGTVLATPFISGVSSFVNYRVYTTDIAYTADYEIDRMEVFPLNQPVLTNNIRVSYNNAYNNCEAFDGESGNIDVSEFNIQPCYGAAVVYDVLYFLKQSSTYSTQDIPGVEPGGSDGNGAWPLHEVSATVGTCGINAYDYGEGWLITACRNGVYIFNGGIPVRLDFQQKELWETINWAASETISVRHDQRNRKILVAIPLPTPNPWMPLDPVNENPTVPNVVLCFNYHGLSSFNALAEGEAVHTTMFGTLACLDMKLKVSTWSITTPYIGSVLQPDLITYLPLVCNGVQNSKIYQLTDGALSDDGNPILSAYWSSPFADAAKKTPAKEGGLGQHQMVFQGLLSVVGGTGDIQISAAPDYILDPDTLILNPLTYNSPLITLPAVEDDLYIPLVLPCYRLFCGYMTNAVGSEFTICKIEPSGTQHSWMLVNPNLTLFTGS